MTTLESLIYDIISIQRETGLLENLWKRGNNKFS